MTAARVLGYWPSRKSRRLARYGSGLPASWNMDVARRSADDSVSLVRHIRASNERMRRRLSSICAPDGRRVH